MPKFVSKGPGKWEAVDTPAKLAQLKKDKQAGKATSVDVVNAQAVELARVVKAVVAERERVAAETAERERKYAAGYVPPTPRPGANAKFRERNARKANA